MRHFLLIIVLFLFVGSVFAGGDTHMERIPGLDYLEALISRVDFAGKNILLLDPLGISDGHGERMLDIIKGAPHAYYIRHADGRLYPVGRSRSGSVMCFPTYWHIMDGFSMIGDVSLAYMRDELERSDTILMLSAGNVGEYNGVTHFPYRQVFKRDDPFWRGLFLGKEIAEGQYDRIFNLLESGNTVLISSAYKVPAFEDFVDSWISSAVDVFDVPEDYVPSEDVMMEIDRLYRDLYGEGPYISGYAPVQETAGFGDFKEYGFVVLWETATCPATAYASVFVLYLRQLWDQADAEDIIAIMQETAIDIGKPGPDEDFGWGVLNANHPKIQSRAMEKAIEGLTVAERDSFLQDLTVAKHSVGFSPYLSKEDGRSVAGLTYHSEKFTLMATTGSTSSPFVDSAFLQQKVSRIGTVGLRLSLFSDLSLVGTHTRLERESMSAHKTNLGLQYRTKVGDHARLSLYGGYRDIRGTVGIPGYDTLDVPQTPFKKRMVNVTASFDWPF